MKIVHCKECGWLGAETDLYIPGHCPSCLDGDVYEMTSNSQFSKDELRVLWLVFGDVPIDDYDLILEPFMDWPAGTLRFDIWHWFDAKYDGGVHALIEEALR